MRGKSLGSFGLFAVLLLSTTAVRAEKRDFEGCDGLRAPGRSGDGMAGAANRGPFGGEPFVGGRPGDASPLIAACTAALADPRLLPEHGPRRAYLLRARGLGRLAGGDPAGALADIDAAAAAGGALASDPLYARSMGVSLTLARAAAWQVRGDRAKARALAAEAAAVRPYSVSIQSVAAAIAQRSREPDAGGSPYAALPPLMPDALSMQFTAELDAGHFARAAALFPRLRTAFPKAVAAPFAPFALDGEAGKLVEAVIVTTGASYAYAATGEPRRATALMADSRAKLAVALAPAATKDGTQPAANPLAQPLNAISALWTTMTQARVAIAENRTMDALKALVGTGLPVNAASVELLTALRAALPEAQRALAPDPALIAAKLDERRKAEALDIDALRRSMPVPETSRRLADYERSGSPFLRSLIGIGFSADGFKSKEDAVTGTTTVEFVGGATSAPVVEEMTLLRAADLARQRGKPGLLIVGRRDYRRTMTTYQGYGRIPISSQPAGYKTELEVRFVDPAALPADLAAERDRVLDANRVYAALAPIYIPPETRTAGR